MTKFIVLLAAVSLLCRWIFGRWPWDFFRPKPTQAQSVFRARKLLGVSSEASHSQIIEAHKRLVRQVHPDMGGTTAQVHEANAARDTLIDNLPESEKPT